MNNEETISVDTFTLTNDKGQTLELAIMDEFDFENRQYVVVSLVTDDTVGDDTFLLRAVNEGSEITAEMIEDDEEFNRASAYYETL